MSENLEGQSGRNRKRGRPVGSTVLDRDSFLRQSVAVYAQKFSNGFARPKQDEVAGELGIGRHTFLRYLHRYETSWSQIQNLGLQAAREKKNCTCKSNI